VSVLRYDHNIATKVLTISRTVIATTSTQEKIDWLLNLPNGATHAANYKTQNFCQVVSEVTEGKGADVIIDFVGKTHFQKNLDSLALDGRMTILALMSGKPAVIWDNGLLLEI
jgi:NADPH:quinone reductase-like Zn-dependent oxidoreductase